MRTYTKTSITTEPRLSIMFDSNTESPRTWSNLGYFFTNDSQFISPDGNNRKSDSNYQESWVLYDIMIEQGDYADDQADHIKRIKKEAKRLDIIIKAIYPVVKYEHGNVVYRRGTQQGFDYSNIGFYIITEESQKEMGTKKKDWEKCIDGEIETYTKWVNGEVYSFVLYDEKGEVEDSCAGFYNIEDIKDYLPEDWKDEDLTQYLTY